MVLQKVIHRLKVLGNPENVAGMARYGIVAKKSFGVPAPELKKLVKQMGRDHLLAQQLWRTGIYDARILAALTDDPALVTERQAERWVRDFDNWAICDGCCIHLFRKTPFAWKKAKAWSNRSEEFVKRGGFTLMATLAVHDKEADDQRFIALLPIIRREALDERNGVKKGVSWALRQIGKRNIVLNNHAVRAAEEIKKIDSRPARWIASDALRELQSTAVRKRLKNRLD